MNFTREPIIETVITPKEGYKLHVRSSKAGGQEEYLVDSVEVVSFGHSFFFRSLEKPKCFLVPVSDYEIVETKEARAVLKNTGVERAIKIGGGREAPLRHVAKEAAIDSIEGVSQEERVEEEVAIPTGQGRPRRDRRRHRRRRGDRPEGIESSEKTENTESKETSKLETDKEGGGASDETQVSSPMFTTLLPPPPTLISETLSRYKEKSFFISERGLPPEQIEEEISHEAKEEEREEEGSSSNTEGTQMSRTTLTSSSESFSGTTFTSPFFGNYR